MKTLSIASPYESKPKASTETLTPACEGIFDFLKRSNVEKEVKSNPNRISTEKKSAEQMMLTIKHYLDNPDAYSFHGEKVSINTKIFGGNPGSLNLQAILNQLENFAKSWYRDFQAADRFSNSERKVREKHTEALKKEFWELVKTNPDDAGAVLYETKIKGMMGQFTPNGAAAYAEGKLKFTECHAALWEYETYKASWGQAYGIGNALYEKVDVTVPALNQSTGERLFKILMSFAQEKNGAFTFPEVDKAFDACDNDDRFFADKAMHRTCKGGDDSWAYSVIWNSDGDSAQSLMENYVNHVYDVLYAWVKIAVMSLQRNPNVALEEYYDHTPACEGFVDIIKAGFEKLTGTGDKREKHKLAKDKYGNSTFNPKQQGKKLQEIVSEALADTYNNPKWVEKYVDNTSSMYEHAEMGYLYAGKRLVKLEDLVSELRKVRGFLDDLRRREQPFIDVRLDVYKKVETISKIAGSEQRVKLAIELYDKHKDKLESFIGSRIPTSIAKYEAVGCQGPLFVHNPPTYNYYYPSKGKSFEYPIPSKENYKVYIETLNALLKETEDFDNFLQNDHGFSVPYFEDLPEFIWDDMEGTEYDEYYDKYLSNVGSTQSREELVDFYYSYRNILANITIAVYHLLFNAQKLNPANEGLVDFFKEMFSSEKSDIKKIVKGTKESEAEVAALIQKTYNNPSWVAKVPETAVPLKGAEFGYLFFAGKQLDSNGVLTKSQELFKVADTGVSRLAKNAEVRWKIIQSLQQYDDDYSYKHRVDDKEDMIQKVFGEFTSFFKPMPVIGSQKPWFTPTDYTYLTLAIEPYSEAAKSITKADIIKLRDQVPAVTKELLRMIASLTESACSGHSPGNEERMLADDEEVFFEALELEHDRGSMITHALFDGEGGDKEEAGTAPAVALRTAFLLTHVLKAYLTWAFKRA